MSDLNHKNEKSFSESGEGPEGYAFGAASQKREEGYRIDDYRDSWIKSNNINIDELLEASGFQRDKDSTGQDVYKSKLEAGHKSSRSSKSPSDLSVFLSRNTHNEDIKPVDIERDLRSRLPLLKGIFSSVVKNSSDEAMRSNAWALSGVSAMAQIVVMTALFNLPGLAVGVVTALASHIYMDKKFKPHAHSRGMNNYTAFENRRLTHKAAAKDREANKLREELRAMKTAYDDFLSRDEVSYSLRFSRENYLEIEGPFDDNERLTGPYKAWERESIRRIKELYNEATMLRQKRDPEAAPTIGVDPVFPNLKTSEKDGPRPPEGSFLQRMFGLFGGNNDDGRDDPDGGQLVPDDKSPEPSGPSVAIG